MDRLPAIVLDAEALIKAREEAKLKQHELAALANVRPPCISKAEAGKNNLNLRTYIAVCQVLKAPMGSFIKEEISLP